MGVGVIELAEAQEVQLVVDRFFVRLHHEFAGLSAQIAQEVASAVLAVFMDIRYFMWFHIDDLVFLWSFSANSSAGNSSTEKKEK